MSGAHPRGVVEVEVLGRRRRLRASLSLPGAYVLRSGGHTFSQFLQELGGLKDDQWGYDAGHLLAMLACLCELGGDPIEQQPMDDALYADFPSILGAIKCALIEGGVLQTGASSEKKVLSRRSPSSRGTRGSR